MIGRNRLGIPTPTMDLRMSITRVLFSKQIDFELKANPEGEIL